MRRKYFATKTTAEALEELGAAVEKLQKDSSDQLDLEFESQKTFDFLNGQMESLRKAMSSMSDVIVEEIATLRRDCATEISSDQEASVKRIADVETQMEGLKRTLSAQSTEHHAELSAIRMALEELQAQSRTLNQELQDRVYAHVNSSVGQLHASVNQAHSQLRSNANTLVQVQTHLRNTSQNLESSINSNEDQLSHVKNQLGELREYVGLIRQDLDDFKTTTINALTAMRQTLQSQKSQGDALRVSLAETEVKFGRHIQAVKQEVTVAKRLYEDYRTEAVSDAEAVHKEVAETRKATETLRKETRAATGALAKDIASLADDAARGRTAWSSAVDSWRRDADDLGQKIRALNDANLLSSAKASDDLRLLQRKAEDQMARLQSQYQELVESHHSLDQNQNRLKAVVDESLNALSLHTKASKAQSASTAKDLSVLQRTLDQDHEILSEFRRWRDQAQRALETLASHTKVSIPALMLQPSITPH
eukprot:Rmarinus@m.29112